MFFIRGRQLVDDIFSGIIEVFRSEDKDVRKVCKVCKDADINSGSWAASELNIWVRLRCLTGLVGMVE